MNEMNEMNGTDEITFNILSSYLYKPLINIIHDYLQSYPAFYKELLDKTVCISIDLDNYQYSREYIRTKFVSWSTYRKFKITRNKRCEIDNWEISFND